MDDLDRRIIQELQENFPLQTDPYELIADRLGIPVEALWQRITALVASGVIRRIGFSMDSRTIGFSSTLAALRIAPHRIEEASALIAACPQITHSYLRDDPFNIWFTVIAETPEMFSNILDSIQSKLSIPDQDIMNLPAEKIFKLDARFR